MGWLLQKGYQAIVYNFFALSFRCKLDSCRAKNMLLSSNSILVYFQKLVSRKNVALESLICRQAVVGQSSSICHAVFRQSSGSLQAVFRQSSSSLQAVVQHSLNCAAYVSVLFQILLYKDLFRFPCLIAFTAIISSQNYEGQQFSRPITLLLIGYSLLKYMKFFL